jgi:hypothetical protein
VSPPPVRKLVDAIGGRWRELPFREVFLACFPDPQTAAAGRQLAKWIHDDLSTKGILSGDSAERRALLQGLRVDLEVVEEVLEEISRASEPEPDDTDLELVEAARVFRVEVQDLVARMGAVLEGRHVGAPRSSVSAGS